MHLICRRGDLFSVFVDAALNKKKICEVIECQMLFPLGFMRLKRCGSGYAHAE